MSTRQGAGRSWLSRVFTPGRGGRGLGGSSVCRCPNCGYTMPHNKGVPCSTIQCPRCSTPMRGENC